MKDLSVLNRKFCDKIGGQIFQIINSKIDEQDELLKV